MIEIVFKIRTNNDNESTINQLNNIEENKSNNNWEYELIAFDGWKIYNKSNKKDLLNEINQKLKIKRSTKSIDEWAEY